MREALLCSLLIYIFSYSSIQCCYIAPGWVTFTITAMFVHVIHECNISVNLIIFA